jgi:hypothetical protein
MIFSLSFDTPIFIPHTLFAFIFALCIDFYPFNVIFCLYLSSFFLVSTHFFPFLDGKYFIPDEGRGRVSKNTHLAYNLIPLRGPQCKIKDHCAEAQGDSFHPNWSKLTSLTLKQFCRIFSCSEEHFIFYWYSIWM